MNEPSTRFDRFNLWIKNNPIVASLIVVGTIVIALSTFTDAAKNLLSLVVKETRPDINGEWKAEVTYDWNNAKYTETFTFGGDGEEVYGTASFLRRRRGILEGKVRKDKLEFVTKTREVSGAGWNNQKDAVHRYRGKVFRDEIKFIMQTEGGFSEHVPIEFTARKVPNISLKPTR
jgi:hypothetical protein